MSMHSRTSLRFVFAFFALNFIPLGFMSQAMAMGKASHPLHKPQCSSYFSKILDKSVDYCIDRSTPDVPMIPGEPVTYFFHGTNGSAQTWVKNDYAPALEKLRDSGQPLPPMTFVSFSTSRYSFFTDHPFDAHSAYETWFITEFIPYIEGILPVCNQKSCRGVMGESMGGFGALKTILRHPDMFSAVAVESPALPPFSVRDSILKWEDFFLHHPIGPVMGLILIHLVRHIMPTEAAWDVQDPIQLTENFQGQYPPIYFDMGGHDKYGFNVGYEILKGDLDEKAIPYSTIFEPTAGHDMWKRHAGDAIQFMFNHVGQN